MWDLSVNGHWLFPVVDKITVYPLAGLGILGATASIPDIDLGEWGSLGGSVSTSDVAFNFGGGIDYKLTEQLILNAELKYKISDAWNRLLISAGLAYKF
jgi:outer membrane protein X